MITNNNFNDQKHCSCKKSRCLKLYCDCFSAGLFCGEACSCQECFNSLDYEDTVEEARQQIKLRNPQAFSPKIHNENRDHPIPIAGKHKKGCNCKKSMCIKRYCECYQANVGCSSECRCEGCKNVFGKKGEYNACKESTPSTIPWAQVSQHSGEEKSAAGLHNGCYIPSPGYANNNCDMISGTSSSNGNFDTVSSDQQSHPYVESVKNQFTPPDTAHINARHDPAFMSNLPPTATDCPNISRANETLISDPPVISWTDSLVTPESLFGGPKVDDSNEKTIDNIIDDKRQPINARISTNSLKSDPPQYRQLV